MPLVPLSGAPVFDGSYPVEGARLYAFDAGTTTPRPLYLTKDLDPTRVHPRPVQIVGGRLPVMWAGVGDYDLVITDRFDAQISRIEGLPGDAPPAASTGFDPLRQLPTGALVRIYGTGRRNGFARANGLTIGSGASDATERANDDCHDLFVFLYNADPNLPVIGGRSPAGAEADWNANKTITLPDYQGRVQLAPLDMGNASAASGRLVGGKLGSAGAVLGASGGEAAHVITPDELASHSHVGRATIDPAGGFTPSGTVQAGGQHTHGVIYNTQTAYQTPGAGGAVVSVGQAPNNNSGVTNPDGQHAHGFVGNAQPDHTHTASVTTDLTGGSAAHNTLPPFICDCAYLKL